MRENRGKILGTIIFILLIFCLLYLTFFSVQRTNKGGIEMIELTGNNLLSGNDYLSFSKLDNPDNGYEKLSLAVIKDRIEKHPYVKNADVELSDFKNVKIFLTEKKIMAVVLSGAEPYLISEDFQVLPLLTNTKFVD